MTRHSFIHFLPFAFVAGLASAHCSSSSSPVTTDAGAHRDSGTRSGSTDAGKHKDSATSSGSGSGSCVPLGQPSTSDAAFCDDCCFGASGASSCSTHGGTTARLCGAIVGDPCTSDDTCADGYCTKGKCTLSPVGGVCRSSDDCTREGYDIICTSGKCVDGAGDAG